MEELILKERETREKLVDIINKSGLPAVMLKPILKEILEQINLLEQKEYVQAKIKKHIGGIHKGEQK